MRKTASSRLGLGWLLVLLISLTAQMGRFSWQGGRFMVNADSVQYVDGAEALLEADKTPNFGFRKPGYSLVLAGVGAVFGNMGYAAVAFNHFCYALLPVAAYGLGCNLRSRWVGWTAAILTLAQVQTLVWPDHIMSESVYTCLLTFSLLLLACGLSRERKAPWLVSAGLLLGGAWLVRAVAVAVIFAAVVGLVWVLRAARVSDSTSPPVEERSHKARRILASCLCFLVPIGGAVLLECQLNGLGGHFRTCTSGLGTALLMRARYLQGEEFPDTPDARACLSLLPERSPQDAYRVNKMDAWVARHRAMQTHGMDEWEFDTLARRAAMEMFASDPLSYLSTGGTIFLRQALRRKNLPRLAQCAWPNHAPMLLPSDAPQTAESREHWYTYWALPQRSRAQSQDLVARMRAATTQKAPFIAGEPWTTIRYATLLPDVRDVVKVLCRVGAIWPGFALIACCLLGLNRKTCLLLALACAADCALIGVCGATDESISRFQDVWIVIDTTLAAALVVGVLAAVKKAISSQLSAVSRKGAERLAALPLMTDSRQAENVDVRSIHAGVTNHRVDERGSGMSRRDQGSDRYV